jgi:iron complex transport system substrate-binding protein
MSFVPSRRSGRRTRILSIAAVLLGTALALTACSTGEIEPAATARTVTVATNTGSASVPFQPARVAVLDNTSFATLKAFGIDPVAVPKPLLPHTGYASWIDSTKVADVGSHREPDFEALSEAAPDLIIGGYRFSEAQSTLAKIATTIDIAPGDEAKGGYLESLRTQTRTLGEIFGKQQEAKKIVADFDAAIAKARKATNGETVFLAVASGGRVDNGSSRIGRLLEGVDLTNVLADDASATAVHNDSGLAPETIAQLDPEWMVVMDRDAAVADKPTPAKELIESNEAFADTTFLTKGNIVYLAPSFYLDEGIQAYTTAFTQLSTAFTA